MPHYIKTGYWALEKNGYKGWLNLEDIIPGGSGGASSVTKAEIDVLISSNALVPGSTYIISGVDVPLYGGTTVILKAATTNELELAGHGIFYNPKYLNSQATPNNGYGIYNSYMFPTITNVVGGAFSNGDTITADNGATATFVALNVLIFLTGDWSLATTIDNGLGVTADITGAVSPSYTIGQDAIWGGKHWTNLTGNVGSFVDKHTLDAVNWQEVPFNSTDYNVEIDVIHYDYIHDMIIRRKDRWDNDVDGNFQVFYEFASPDVFVFGFGNPIKDFQWGNGNEDFNTIDYNSIGVQSNYVKDSYLECINFIGSYLWHNTLTQRSYMYNNITDVNSSISNNTLTSNGRIYDNTLANSSINNILTNNSSIYNNILSNSGIGDNTLTAASIDSNILTIGGILNNTLTSSNISNNTLTSSSSIYNNTLDDNSSITENALSNNSRMANNTLNSSVFSSNVLNDNSKIDNSDVYSSEILNNQLDVSSTIETNTLSAYSKVEDNILSSSQIVNNSINDNSNINFSTLNSSSIGSNVLNSQCVIGGSVLTSSNVVNNTLTNSSTMDSNTLSSNSGIYNNRLDASYINSNTLTISSNIANNTLSSSTFNFSSSGTLTGKTISYIEANYANATFDISAATIIYGDYSKQIFKNSAGVVRLGYYNASDVFTVVNVNA